MSAPDVLPDASTVFTGVHGFTGRLQTPYVRVDAVQEAGEWCITVTDNGQGFEAQHASAIFEPFKRLHGKNIKGSG